MKQVFLILLCPILLLASCAAPHSKVIDGVSYPYGEMVSGHPGIVRSPHNLNEFVDVQGFAKNTKVKCPHTGKIFLVPGEKRFRGPTMDEIARGISMGSANSAVILEQQRQSMHQNTMLLNSSIRPLNVQPYRSQPSTIYGQQYGDSIMWSDGSRTDRMGTMYIHNPPPY